MTLQTLEIDEKTRVVIENVGGDLTLRGWKRVKLQMQGFTENDSIKEDVLSLRCAGDGILRLPHNIPVEVQNVGGDATIKGLDGALSLNAVGGDLRLRDVNKVTINSAGGDLIAKRVQGDLVVKNVGGDAILQDLSGQFSAKAVGGDLNLREISGGIEAAVGGETVVAFSPVPWQAYSIQAGGDIFAKIPEDVNAEFELESRAKKIQINLKEDSQTLLEKVHSLTLGEGGPSVSLSAGGEILLTSEGSEWATGPEVGFGTSKFDAFAGMENMFEDIAQQTTAQIEEQLGLMEEHLNTHLSDLAGTLDLAGLSEEKAQEVQERIENAQQRAEQSVQRAQAKLQRKLAQTQRKAARRARREKRKAAEFDVEAMYASKEKAARAVSDEERMMILKMLQEKKITTDQANDLLAALEGKV